MFIGEDEHVSSAMPREMNLPEIATVMQGEGARGLPELRVSGGGAMCSGGRWRARSGVVRWWSSLRGGGDVAGEKRKKKDAEKARRDARPPIYGHGACAVSVFTACGYRNGRAD